MNEVLRNWRTYVPCDDYITQRGATVLLDADDSVIYCHRDQSLLGYSATMERPLAFLDEVLGLGLSSTRLSSPVPFSAGCFN